MTNHVSELVCTGDLAELFRSLSISFPPEVMSLVQTCDGHLAMGGMDLARQRDLRPLSPRHPLDRAGSGPPAHSSDNVFVARYPGEDGDDGYLRYETLQRLTHSVIDWP
jgi:hypothetical protein